MAAIGRSGAGPTQRVGIRAVMVWEGELRTAIALEMVNNRVNRDIYCYNYNACNAVSNKLVFNKKFKQIRILNN